MKKVMLVFGTRPEAIKMCPLVKEFQKHTDDFETIVCVTRQHREMLDQVLKIGGVDRIMLDNFDTDTTRKAVKIINGRCETESSGGITFKTLRSYAECGVDFISVGALTHSVKGLDMSLKAVK